MEYAARYTLVAGTMAGMEWTDLDQAYLEIFGEHPDLPRCGFAIMDDLVESLSAISSTVTFMPEREPIIYATADRPDVEVLWECSWCPGEVRMVKWVDGAELHQVQYRRPGQLSSNVDDFTTDQVRASTIDPRRGRALR